MMTSNSGFPFRIWGLIAVLVVVLFALGSYWVLRPIANRLGGESRNPKFASFIKVSFWVRLSVALLVGVFEVIYHSAIYLFGNIFFPINGCPLQKNGISGNTEFSSGITAISTAAYIGITFFLFCYGALRPLGNYLCGQIFSPKWAVIVKIVIWIPAFFLSLIGISLLVILCVDHVFGDLFSYTIACSF